MKKTFKFLIAVSVLCVFCTGSKADIGPLTMQFSMLRNTNSELAVWGLVVLDNIVTAGYFVEKDRLIEQYNQGLVGYYGYEHKLIDIGFTHFFQAMISLFSSKAIVTGYKALKTLDIPSRDVQ